MMSSTIIRSLRGSATFFCAGVLAILALTPTVTAQEGLSRDEAMADIRYFARFLEATHPDPYTAFGGRVAFQIEIQRMLETVYEETVSDRLVYDLIRSFLGRMGDGHSWVQVPGRREEDALPRHLPVAFRVAQDEIFVIETTPDYEALIGSRLRGAAGLDLAELREAARRVLPKENDFAADAFLVRLLDSDQQLRRMLPHVAGHVELRLVDLGGAEFVTSLPYGSMPEERTVRRSEGRVPDSSGPIVTTMWPDIGVAYLRLSTIMAREAFQSMSAAGRTDLPGQLAHFYETSLKREMPGDLAEAILGTPSLCQASYALLSSMKDEGSDVLIIDLRGNDGGWATIMKPLYYMLHGDRTFVDDPVRFATRFSEGYLRILGTDLDTYNQKRGTHYELGDLIVRGGERGGDPVAVRSEWMSGLEVSSPECHALLAGLDGRPLFTPRIYVVTDSGTFSAAYDATYRLRRLGAETVGVPPAQSANSFVEGTPFELPDSRLRGAVSRTAVIYPDLPEKEGALLLDHPLSFAEFRKFGFDVNAEIRCAIELGGVSRQEGTR